MFGREVELALAGSLTTSGAARATGSAVLMEPQTVSDNKRCEGKQFTATACIVSALAQMRSPPFMNITRTTRLVTALAAALLGGCAVMSPEECLRADWYTVGVQDGQQGEALYRLDQRTQACAEAKVVPDFNRYHAGRAQGLAGYCRLDNAARLGLAGQPYRGVCPLGIDAEFRQRHAVGLNLYQARRAVDDMENRRRSLETQLERAKTDKERQDVRDDLRRLDREYRYVRDRVRDAEWNFDRFR